VTLWSKAHECTYMTVSLLTFTFLFNPTNVQKNLENIFWKFLRAGKVKMKRERWKEKLSTYIILSVEVVPTLNYFNSCKQISTKKKLLQTKITTKLNIFNLTMILRQSHWISLSSLFTPPITIIIKKKN
jgi:hypothetical protein